MKRTAILCGIILCTVFDGLQAQSEGPNQTYLYVHVQFSDFVTPLPYDLTGKILTGKGISDLKKFLGDRLPDKDVMCDTISHGLAMPEAFMDSNRKSPLLLDGRTRPAWMASIDRLVFESLVSEGVQKNSLSFRYTLWNNRSFKEADQQTIQILLDSASQSDALEQIVAKIADPVLHAMPGYVESDNHSKGKSVNMKREPIKLRNYKQSRLRFNIHYGAQNVGAFDNVSSSFKNFYPGVDIDANRPAVFSLGLEFAIVSKWLIEAGYSQFKQHYNSHASLGAFLADQAITLRSGPFFVNSRCVFVIPFSASQWIEVGGGAGFRHQTLDASGEQYFQARNPPSDHQLYEFHKAINDFHVQLAVEYFPLPRVGLQMKVEKHFTSKVTIPEQVFHQRVVLPQKIVAPDIFITIAAEFVLLR